MSLAALLQQATPGGEWSYVYAEDDSYGHEIIMVKDKHGAQIQCSERCYSPDVEKSIARLIALAPELAQLVEDMAALHRDLIYQTPGWTGSRTTSTTCS